MHLLAVVVAAMRLLISIRRRQDSHLHLQQFNRVRSCTCLAMSWSHILVVLVLSTFVMRKPRTLIFHLGELAGPCILLRFVKALPIIVHLMT